MPAPSEVTLLLRSTASGDSDAAARLFPLVYDELRRLAASHFRNQPAGHTLQPTAVVHEAFLRLVDRSDAAWNDREHFFAVAATAIRQILINHARARQAGKRGSGMARIPLDPDGLASTPPPEELLALDECLESLARLDERKARVVELRFFGGLTMEQIAAVMGLSVTTVEADWRMARAWLVSRLSAGADG